jgi:hypothetical protein
VLAKGAAIVMVAMCRILHVVCTVIQVPCFWWFAYVACRNYDKDMLETLTHLGSHTEAAGHVYVGTIQVKKLQALLLLCS